MTDLEIQNINPESNSTRFDAQVFSGLDNLKHLVLTENKISELSEVSEIFSVTIFCNLKVAHLFPRIVTTVFALKAIFQSSPTTIYPDYLGGKKD